MKAIVLFQIGNINRALDIFQKIPPILKHFNNLTIFISILNTLSTELIIDVLERLKNDYSNIKYIVQIHENKGMDLGPLLLQFKYLVNNNLTYDIFLKIHTKTNKVWSDELMDPLINNVKYIDKAFNTYSDLGLIGCSKWTLEQDRINKPVIVKLLNKLKIENKYFDVINEYEIENFKNAGMFDPIFYIKYNNLPFESVTLAHSHYTNHGINDKTLISHPALITKKKSIDTVFIGGTMFWADYKIYESFFKKYPLYDILYDILEEGYCTNIYPTIVHSLERFICLIPYIENKVIYKI
jgi:hypothetical protein